VGQTVTKRVVRWDPEGRLTYARWDRLSQFVWYETILDKKMEGHTKGESKTNLVNFSAANHGEDRRISSVLRRIVLNHSEEASKECKRVQCTERNSLYSTASMKNLGCSLHLLTVLLTALVLPTMPIVRGQTPTTYLTMHPYSWPTAPPTIVNVPYWEYGLPKQQVAALEALYTSTNGPEWDTTFAGWDQGTNRYDKGLPWSFEKDEAGMYLSDPCQGDYPIEVDSESGHVLPPAGGRGFPWAGLKCMCTLSLISYQNNCYITDIQLGSCNLRGELPVELSDIIVRDLIGIYQQIVSLNFTQNLLTGTIPASYGNLDPLFWTSSANQLSGSIPPELGNWSSTLYLLLGKNKLCDQFQTN